MPNIAVVLKQEIQRLAKKEANAQTKSLRKANSQYRRDIAELKRNVDSLTKQVAFLEKQERRRVETTVPETSAEGRRFSRRGLRTHREKLGIAAADYARLVGVSTQTIYNWENGHSKPTGDKLAALVEVRDLGKREAMARLELLEK